MKTAAEKNDTFHERCDVDVPGVLLAGHSSQIVKAKIVATQSGVVAGIDDAADEAATLGLAMKQLVEPGQEVSPGQSIAVITGKPLQIIRGEDRLLGNVGKFSGVATAARKACRMARGFKIVCGGWKKLPVELKERLRKALTLGGVGTRIIDEPFVYLDKNYVRVFGSISATMEAAGRLPDRVAAIQVRGDTAPIHEEALEAARLGAGVVIVDTGRLEDLRLVSESLREAELRSAVRLAFAGGIALEGLPGLVGEDMDIVDVGRALIDAPLLDYRYDIIP